VASEALLSGHVSIYIALFQELNESAEATNLLDPSEHKIWAAYLQLALDKDPPVALKRSCTAVVYSQWISHD
jgi:hypothetical protein